MNKIPIKVPSNIKFISDWENYEIPKGRCIVDKKVCGCGYTQFCLTNKDNIILCSPRISLLENKSEQNEQCYYFKPITLTSKIKKELNLETEKEASSYIFNLQLNLVSNYLRDRILDNLPFKILVTYDSLPKLLEILHILEIYSQNYSVIVDEFQLIFSDARFKAETELNFVEAVSHTCENVVFLSGTPMLDYYLDHAPCFSGLDYYELIWDSSRLTKININRIKTKNLEKSAVELVKLYKSGNGPVKIVDGLSYKSTEAVLFVNNVSMITNIIKKAELSPEEVNIITSRTSENLKKIKKCGKEFSYGKIPTKGKKHKLITICTSTAFCGVDMYSESAKAYVFSDTNIKTMTVDISLELPQIVGRQRLESNVFRNEVTIYYTSSVEKVSKESLDLEVDRKVERTKSEISSFNRVRSEWNQEDFENYREKVKLWITSNGYKEDYTSFSKNGDLVLNELMLFSDVRSWELHNKIYKNEESVLSALQIVGKVENTFELSKILEIIVSLPTFEERLKTLYEYLSRHPEDNLELIPDEYKIYLNSKIGINFRRDVLDRKISKLKEEENALSDKELLSKIIDYFKLGNTYTRKEIKDVFNSFLNELGYKKVILKANDIDHFFNTRQARTTDPVSNKPCMGFKLLSIKEN